jgi:hypothetical protein
MNSQFLFLHLVKLSNVARIKLIKVVRGCGTVSISSSLAVKLAMSATEHTTQRSCMVGKYIWKKAKQLSLSTNLKNSHCDANASYSFVVFQVRM